MLSFQYIAMKKSANSESSCYSPSFGESIGSSMAPNGIANRVARKKSCHLVRLTKSTDSHRPPAPTNHGSLPDLRQRHIEEFPPAPQKDKPNGYMNTYTASYSSAESSHVSEDHEEYAEPVVMEFEKQVRAPAMRIGAARLHDMVNNHKIETPPVSLQRPHKDKPPSTASTYQFSLDSISISSLDADEQYNGLLAPGALADEKQQKRANGTWLQRVLHTLFKSTPSEQPDEAKLFKPIVFDPSHHTDHLIDPVNRDPDTRYCCCIQIKYWVGIWFVLVLVGCLVGFFVWPRVPSLSVSSLVALEPAHVIYDTQNSSFGLQMPVQINYEIHSGNFYPLRITHVQVGGFDGVTGNKIIDTRLSSIPVAPLRLRFYSANTTLRYLTSDLTDPALTDLFGKCAPQSSAQLLGLPMDGGRQRSLTVRFQIKVDVGNLGWIKQPTVTLNQNLECPQ